MKWYEADKKRLVLEYEKVKSKYPQFKLGIYEGCLAWEGEIHFDSEDKDFIPLKVRIIYDDSYPISPPKVFPIEPKIPDNLWGHEWHRWEEGNICYVNPKNWSINYYTVDVISKVQTWYINFLLYAFKKIDKMPDVGIATISDKGGN